MSDQRLKNLDAHGRRAFLRWFTAAAAVAGVERSHFLNVLSDHAGVALADTAAGSTTAKSVHIVGGNGGLAWFTQLFPYTGVATTPAATSAYYAAGTAAKKATTTNPLVYSPASPFQTLSANPGEWQLRDVDEHERLFDAALHQVEQVGAAADVAGTGCLTRRDGGCDVGRALVVECLHRAPLRKPRSRSPRRCARCWAGDARSRRWCRRSRCASP